MTEFNRENRYTVIKRKDLDKVSPAYREIVESKLEEVAEILRCSGVSDRPCLVIESDWPEYEPTWATIEARVSKAAADKKAAIETFIKDLQKVNGCGFYSIAEDLYDAGYRKQVQP